MSSISILFILLSQTISGALQGLGKVKIPTIALGIGVIIKLILNFILIPIPQIGIYGAVIGSVVCHVVSFTIEFIALQEHLKLELNPIGKMYYIIKRITKNNKSITHMIRKVASPYVTIASQSDESKKLNLVAPEKSVDFCRRNKKRRILGNFGELINCRQNLHKLYIL